MIIGSYVADLCELLCFVFIDSFEKDALRFFVASEFVLLGPDMLGVKVPQLK